MFTSTEQSSITSREKKNKHSQPDTHSFSLDIVIALVQETRDAF